MKTYIFKTVLLLAVALFRPLCLHAASDDTADNSTKKERNLIREGNEAFADSNFYKAIDCYDRALLLNPQSMVADFNKAVALTNVNNPEATSNGKSHWSEADSIFNRVAAATTASNPDLAKKSFYNRGNIAYGLQDFKKSIDMYKKALRIDPSDMQAKENLRLAQLQLQQQQQDQQDKQDDKSQDNGDKQNKQDSNQDKNQDQQEKQDEQQQNQKNQQQQQQQQQQLSGSAQQILQSMQNKENATRKKVNKEENGRPVHGRRSTDKPW